MLVATAIRNSCAHVVESRYHETGVRLWAWGLLVQGNYNFLSQVSRALKVLSFSYLLDIRFFHVNGGCNFASLSLYILLILGSLYNFIGFFFKSLYVFSNVGGLYFYKNIF